MAGPASHDRPGLRGDPTARTPRWRAGDPRYAEALEPLVRSLLGKREAAGTPPEKPGNDPVEIPRDEPGNPSVEILREKPGGRRLARALLPSGETCFLKQFSGDRRAWKRRLGLTPAARVASPLAGMG